MAENPIRKEDIIDIEGLKVGLKEMLKLFELIQVAQQEIKNNTAEMVPVVKELNTTTKEGQQALAVHTKAIEENKQALTELERLEKELIKARSDSALKVEELRQAIARQKKDNKEFVREQNLQKGSLEDLRIKLGQLKEAYTKAAPDKRGGFLEALQKVDKEVRKLEQDMGVHQRNVGNYGSAWDRAGAKVGQANRVIYNLSNTFPVLNKYINNNTTTTINNIGQGFNDLSQGFLGFAGVAGLVGFSLNEMRKAFMSTSQGMDLVNIASSTVNQFFYDMISSSGSLITHFATLGTDTIPRMIQAFQKARVTAQLMNEIRKGDIVDTVKLAELEAELTVARYNAADQTKSLAYQSEWLTKAQKAEADLIEYKLTDAYEELEAIRKKLNDQKDNEQLKMMEAQKMAEIIQIQSEKNLRLESQKTAKEKKQSEDRMKAYLDEIDAKNKADDDRVAKIKQQAEKTKQAEFAIDKAFLDSIYEENVANDERIKDEKIKTFEESMDMWRAIHKKTQEDVFAAEEKRIEDTKKKEIAAAEEVKRIKTTLYSASMDILSNLDSLRASNLESSKQRELKAVGDNTKRKEEIDKKYYEKQKDWAITMAVIKAGLAIVNAWESGSWVENLIESAAIAGITATEISAMSAEEFGEGGEITGRPHSQGGVPITAEGGEYVINKRATSKYKDLITAINADDSRQIAEEVRSRKFHQIWDFTQGSMAELNKQDPYTKAMYELMRNDVKIYQDSNGDTVIRHPDGRRQIIRKYQN